MLPPPRELALPARLALDAPLDTPPKPPLLPVREELEGMLRLPARSPPVVVGRLPLPTLDEPARLLNPWLVAPVLGRLAAAPLRVWPLNLLALFWLVYGAPPRWLGLWFQFVFPLLMLVLPTRMLLFRTIVLLWLM